MGLEIVESGFNLKIYSSGLMSTLPQYALGGGDERKLSGTGDIREICPYEPPLPTSSLCILVRR